MPPVDHSLAQRGPGAAWSCVLDDTPALWTHFLIWIATLTECAGVPLEDIAVHSVADLRPDIGRLTARLGLEVRRVPRFDARSPHANKISQCFGDFGGTQRVVLTDVDVAFLARPPVERIATPIAGKPVDFANPTIAVLGELFRAASLPMPHRQLVVPFVDWRGVSGAFETLPANYNGGFYVVERAVLGELGSRWAHWARWLLDAGVIPRHFAVNVDQIAFCMAVHELGLETTTLDSAWNLPSHVPTPAGDAAPFVVHHHGQLDRGLNLLPLRPPRHEASIAEANEAIARFLHRHGIGLPGHQTPGPAMLENVENVGD